ncbi:ribose 5-phosphate isomerase B [Streptosporangium becharense]|uniref:Ribose 5-phosphate isomerase B n=1 Tax=Streptosporangium becharense TaxID=1816182 RepID=A0A7W9IHR8_9ACTN|nr:RpiB/LacA/LacB family sugar-phosphate isomerase [Streptosporangium becharense]MBB2912355.1 ribose 5-phosphate isomerase B [Streptosporangium becharense]MBB5820816.1 ribose 5-phosphate isomerase B [Streptosporangium becharense]
MRISVASDSLDGVAPILVSEIEKRGHTVIPHGAVGDERADWAWCCSLAAADVASGAADQAVVCCWTGTGASIAANKVAGVRAALCVDAATADGARRWNDANVLAISLRLTSAPLLGEILDAWFAGAPSLAEEDQANIAYLSQIEN